MRTVREADVWFAIPEDVELLRLVPAGLVVVGAAQAEHHGRPLGYLHPAELGVAGHLAHEIQQRGGLPADAFLDGLGGQQAAVGAYGGELVWVGQQGQRKARRRAGRRLAPAGSRLRMNP